MQAIFGVIFHFIGGFASGSFYIPYKKVRGWAWESFWIVGGLFSWLIVPPIAAWLTIPNFTEIIKATNDNILWFTYLFGLLWGIGGLTYGLGVRYLGVSLGSTIILGLCMVFGALVPSVYYQFVPQAGKDTISTIAGSNWGLIVLSGLAVCIIGIIFCGKAGTMKEKQLNADLLNRHLEVENSKVTGKRKQVLISKSVAADSGGHSAIFEEVAITPEAPPSVHDSPDGNSTEYKFALGLTLAII